MNAIVIYNSQTGFTKKYADWVAEQVNAECVEFSKAVKKDLQGYDAIIFGGWAVAGSISKLKWFKNNLHKWAGKKLVVFCVGASPAENPEIGEVLPKNFTADELKQVKLVYCPGGLNYEKMSVSSRLMMKTFVKMLKMKKNKTETDIAQIEIMSSSYDISDMKYAEPIINYLKED